jgi:hypothetical protein
LTIGFSGAKIDVLFSHRYSRMTLIKLNGYLLFSANLNLSHLEFLHSTLKYPEAKLFQRQQVKVPGSPGHFTLARPVMKTIDALPVNYVQPDIADTRK